MRMFTKDPAAVKDYEWNWAPWLGADTINQITFVTTEGLSVDNYFENSGVIIAWISGGTEGSETGLVRCTIDTVAGRTDVKSARFRIEDQ